MGSRGPYTNSQIDRGKIPGMVEPNRLRLLARRLESPLQRVTTYLSRLLRFSDLFIQNVESQEPPYNLSVMKSVTQPLFRLRGHLSVARDHPSRDPLPGPARKLQPKLTIGAPEARVWFHRSPLQPIHVFKTPQRGFVLLSLVSASITAACPVHQGSIVRSLAESYCLTSLLTGKAALREKMGHDLLPLNRP